MNAVHQKIIDAVIQKAEKVCPDSLALIGLYGSAATGDTHEKSDLDLLILINDEHGWQLADGLILNDTGIGYDLYCTSWEMLEDDAACNHAHLSKLFDAPLIYIKDPDAAERLQKLRKNAADLLASDARYAKAQAAFENAKKMYADCFLTDTISQIRLHAGAVIHFLLDAVMLHHGRYFQKGVKRTFEELGALSLSFDMETQIMAVIRAETADAIRSKLTKLMRSVQTALSVPNQKAAPTQSNLAGTYEEMVSNWQNKMKEAVKRDDLFSSFMNMVSFQFMLRELAQNIDINEQDIMEHFDPDHLERNAAAFDAALNRYLKEYQKAGLQPKCFANADAFMEVYLNATQSARP